MVTDIKRDLAKCHRIADALKLKAENAGSELQSYLEIRRQWLLLAEAREKGPTWERPVRKRGRPRSRSADAGSTR